MEKSDSTYSVVQEMYNTLWVTFDADKFEKLFAEKAEISYMYNDQPTHVDLKEFFNRMRNGHFNNVTNVKVLKLNIERAAKDNLFLTGYTVESDRKGLGRDENGPGRYIHIGSGGVVVENGHITSFTFNFEKKRI